MCSLIARPNLAHKEKGSGKIEAISRSCSPSRDPIEVCANSHMIAEQAESISVPLSPDQFPHRRLWGLGTRLYRVCYVITCKSIYKNIETYS